MTACQKCKDISCHINKFMINVPDVKEESITDYLCWRLREISNIFKYMSIHSFTRHQENTLSGADFELELWLVGDEISVPLIVQAKKFIGEYGSYVSKLNYPKGTKNQLKTLLSYAKAKRFMPVYFVYTQNESGIHVACNNPIARDEAIFVIGALHIKDFADNMFGRKISLSSILSKGIPFSCLFCCPIRNSKEFYSGYFGKSFDESILRFTEEVPSYVRYLLNSPEKGLTDEAATDHYITSRLDKVRNVAVMDFRSEGDN